MAGHVCQPQELLGTLQNSVQHQAELLWLSRDPQPTLLHPRCWGEHEPSPPPPQPAVKQHQGKPFLPPLLFSLCLLCPLSCTHRLQALLLTLSLLSNSHLCSPSTPHICILGPWNSAAPGTLPWCHPCPLQGDGHRDVTPLWWTRIKGIIKINLLNRRYFPFCAVPRELGGLAAGIQKVLDSL